FSVFSLCDVHSHSPFSLFPYTTLFRSGSYLADWYGCLGRYGDASGSWKLSDKRIVLTPKKERDMMKGHLKTLDVLKHQGSWILVDRKSTRLNSSHGSISYAVFCLKKKR